jgi:hypothetical protein
MLRLLLRDGLRVKGYMEDKLVASHLLPVTGNW